jgi:hypothetical protein
LLWSALLVMRCAVFRGFELGTYEIYFDRWHLGAVRLIDFGAVGILFIRGRSYLKPLSIRPLASTARTVISPGLLHALTFLFCWTYIAR